MKKTGFVMIILMGILLWSCSSTKSALSEYPDPMKHPAEVAVEYNIQPVSARDPRGWELTLFDDFIEESLNPTKWQPFYGDIELSDGILRIPFFSSGKSVMIPQVISNPAEDKRYWVAEIFGRVTLEEDSPFAYLVHQQSQAEEESSEIWRSPSLFDGDFHIFGIEKSGDRAYLFIDGELHGEYPAGDIALPDMLERVQMISLPGVWVEIDWVRQYHQWRY